MHILLADDKAIHEEDTKQQQHAASIGHHNLAGCCGYEAVQVQPNLVNKEQEEHEHEKPAVHTDNMKANSQHEYMFLKIHAGNKYDQKQMLANPTIQL